ncbi:TY-Chap2 family putative peptide chaperone [Microbacterium sp. bgisy189]|uniref:TY-Chap2 family putative peptide chaperone n=1 Tax=Microbacterium sp. bgisy189 TaxID=3413798 RepID=UPI003EB6F51D
MAAGPVSCRFWALLRGSAPVALVSAEGRFSFDDGSVDLMDEYIRHNRRMPGMVANLLMDRL